MSNEKLKELVLKLAQPLVEAAGLEIWGLEIVEGPQTVVRLFIDAPHGQQADASLSEEASSATINQCEEISRQLGLALEVEDPIANAWALEVSSPGLERKFFRLQQMDRYIGDIIDVRLWDDLPEKPGRKALRGKLLAISEDGFDLEPCSISGDGALIPDAEPVCHIPWEKTRRASRMHLFQPTPKPGKGSKQRVAGTRK